MTDVRDRNGEPIRRGDQVCTRIRDGKHEGTVDRIVTDDNDTDGEGVKNPPKVLYINQHGKAEIHSPATLQHVEKEEGVEENQGPSWRC